MESPAIDIVSFNQSVPHCLGIPLLILPRSQGFLDLPFDILHMIALLLQTRPVEEWMPLMYCCTAWNALLSEELLRRRGFLKLAASRDAPRLQLESTLDLQSFVDYSCLLHWRRSPFFGRTDTLKLQLSRDNEERNLQLSAIAQFLGTLAPGASHFRVVHIYLNDFESGVDLTYLKRVVFKLNRSGCAHFWLYSSYIALPPTNDTSGHPNSLAVDPEDEVGVNSHLERLLIQSASALSSSLLPWLGRTLETSKAMTCIDVLSLGLDVSQWAHILSRVHLPHLTSLRIAGVGIETLARFLSRHSAISSLSLDGLVLEEDDGAARARDITLPQLHTIEGTEQQIASVLGLLRPTPLMRLGNVDFRADLLSAVSAESTFDTEAHLRAFRCLHTLRAYSLLFMAFDFPALGKFSEPFFDRDGDDGLQLESRLSVDMLDLRLVIASKDEARELLVRRTIILINLILTASFCRKLLRRGCVRLRGSAD